MPIPTNIWPRLVAALMLAFIIANWFFRWVDSLLVLLIALAFVTVTRSAAGKQALIGPRWLVPGAFVLLALAVLRMLAK